MAQKEEVRTKQNAGRANSSEVSYSPVASPGRAVHLVSPLRGNTITIMEAARDDDAIVTAAPIGASNYCSGLSAFSARSIHVKFADLDIQTIESAPFAENSYVIGRTGQPDCVIVDPGFEPGKIVQCIAKFGLRPVAILNTHGHSDHIAGNEAMKQQWPEIPLVIGTDDAAKLLDPQKNLSGPFGLQLISPPADQLVQDGETLRFAGMEWLVRETPGHSAGHVVFIYQAEPIVVVGGDVLFRGSVGRTDFPDGSFEQLADSIHQKLFVLADETVVLPGHGPPTTIGAEIESNPYVGIPAGYQRR